MRALLSIAMLLIIGWAASLGWFLQQIPQHPLPPSATADAIIVLTGGAGRVEHGLAMLSENAAPVLFISGVGPHVTRAQLLAAHAPPVIAAKIMQSQPLIVLDYVAATTETNADQAEAFVRARGIHSIRLVTAHYHMPRSMLEFRRAMPGIAIAADPVFPEGFQREQWWRHDNTRRLVFSECWKYYGAMLRPDN